MKKQKGITLISLIVTISVLLILAAVAISNVTDDGVLDKTKEEKYAYEISQEKSNLKTEVLKWQSISSHEPTLENYLDEIYGEENVEPNTDDTITVTVPSGNKYIVTDGGLVEVWCDHTNTVVKNVVTATCTTEGYTGDTVCTRCERIVVTGTTIAALNHPNKEIRNETETYTGDTYCKDCGIKIASGSVVCIPDKNLKVGSYVEYDVSYTDMYQGTKYTSTNGWRYLGTDDSGRKLLITTGIPVVLWIHTQSYKYAWWDTDTTLNNNVRATNGLIENFAKIPYTQTTSGTSVSALNTAIGRFAGETISGMTYTVIGDTFKSSTYASKIKNVRTLTLAELNRAVNSATNGSREETSYSSGYEDLTDEALGLFDMQDLTGYSADYSYWLAEADSDNVNYIIYVDNDGGTMAWANCNYSTYFKGACENGVRPVVVLESGVGFIDSNGDGVLEIQ